MNNMNNMNNNNNNNDIIKKYMEQIQGTLDHIFEFNKGVNKDLISLMGAVKAIHNFNKAVEYKFVNLDNKVDNKFNKVDQQIDSKVKDKALKYFSVKYQGLIAFFAGLSVILIIQGLFMNNMFKPLKEDITEIKNIIGMQYRSPYNAPAHLRAPMQRETKSGSIASKTSRSYPGKKQTPEPTKPELPKRDPGSTRYPTSL